MNKNDELAIYVGFTMNYKYVLCAQNYCKNLEVIIKILF